MIEPRINLLQRKPDDQWDEQPTVHKKTSPKRWLALAGGMLVLFLLIKIIFFPTGKQPMAYGTSLLRPSHTSFLQSVKNYFFDPSNVLDGQADDRINILLLGIGGEGHDGPYLTDTDLIVSLKPSTKEIALVSIPRDLSVQIPGQGWRKINSADAFGEALTPGEGGDYARKVFEKTFNLSIPYYVRIDFKAFEEIVDEVGGVTVTVPRSFTDSQFPGMNQFHQEDTSFQTITFTQGTETMNGERALQFARSRHGNNGEGSDFARARRQQLVIEALKQKLLSSETFTNPTTIQNIWNSLNTHVATNLNLGQILYLASTGKEYAVSKTVVLDNSPTGFLVDSIGDNGAYLLSPRAGNFDLINNVIASVFTSSTVGTSVSLTSATTSPTTIRPIDFSPGTTTSIAVEIQNGTWRAGIASKLGQSLQTKQYSVVSVSNAVKRPIDRTTIYIINPLVSSSSTASLSSALHAPVSTILPEWLKDEYTSPAAPSSTAGIPKYSRKDDYLIVLGNDYQE